MEKIVLSGVEMEDQESLQDYLQDMLPLPDYYGRNLDALYDALTELEEPLQVCLTDTHALIAQLGEYGEALMEVFEEAAVENENFIFEIQD